jgi:phage-related protein
MSLQYYLLKDEHVGKLTEVKKTLTMSCIHIDMNYQGIYCNRCGIRAGVNSDKDKIHFIPINHPFEMRFKHRLESDDTLIFDFSRSYPTPRNNTYTKVYGTNCFDFKKDLKKYLEDRGCLYHEDRLGIYR